MGKSHGCETAKGCGLSKCDEDGVTKNGEEDLETSDGGILAKYCDYLAKNHEDGSGDDVLGCVALR